jgi:hypothetical protein
MFNYSCLETLGGLGNIWKQGSEMNPQTDRKESVTLNSIEWQERIAGDIKVSSKTRIRYGELEDKMIVS